MVTRAGFEPALSDLRRRCPSARRSRHVGSPARIRTWASTVNSRAYHRSTSEDQRLVESRRVELRPEALQRVPAPRCAPQWVGARGPIRTGLVGFSGRCNHQICYPSMVGADGGSRTRAPSVARWATAVIFRPQRAWWAGTELNRHRLCGAFTAPWARQCPARPERHGTRLLGGRRLSTSAPSESARSSETWLQGTDSNRRPRGYEPRELPDCSTLQKGRQRSTRCAHKKQDGGRPRCRTPRPEASPAFKAGCRSQRGGPPVADGAGFEPAGPRGPPAFETGAISRSATHPWRKPVVLIHTAGAAQRFPCAPGFPAG